MIPQAQCIRLQNYVNEYIFWVLSRLQASGARIWRRHIPKMLTYRGQSQTSVSARATVVGACYSERRLRAQTCGMLRLRQTSAHCFLADFLEPDREWIAVFSAEHQCGWRIWHLERCGRGYHTKPLCRFLEGRAERRKQGVGL